MNIGSYTVEVEIYDSAGDAIGTISVDGGRPGKEASLSVGGFVENQTVDWIAELFEHLGRDVRATGRPLRSDA